MIPLLFFVTGMVEFEEEDDRRKGFDDEDDEDEESEPSWQKKSGSDDSSDSFRKPVDFGIDTDISTKLDKLNVMLMVGKGKENQNRASVDSAPTTSRDMFENSKMRTNREDESELKKSNSQLESLRKSGGGKTEPEYQKDLKPFQQSLDREFDQKRLELLEEKDNKIKRLKCEIEQDLLHLSEIEKKKIIKEQDERFK